MNCHIVQIIVMLYALACFCSSCNERSNLNWALKQAGDNRRELEKVIEHYSADDADKEKLAAAIFLIENMPGHCSFDDTIQQYYAEVDSVIASSMSFDEKKSAMLELTAKYTYIVDNIQEDITVINSDYLIHHIDRAFKDWKKKSWAKTLSFDQFCEFLLPYKVTEFQQLDYWKDTLNIKYDSIIQVYVMNSDEGRCNTLDAAHTIHTELRTRVKPVLLDQKTEIRLPFPLLGAHNIDKLPFGMCYDYCVLTVATLRSHGIPGVIDYLPQWGRKWLGHDWNVTFSKWGDEIPYDGIIGAWPADRFWPINEAKPKVFRRTYAINRDVLTYLNETNYKVSSVANQFRVDVTDHYGKTTDIPITALATNSLKDKFVYLSVFNNKGWTPVEFKKIKGKSALFDKMGRDIVYMPLGFNGDTLVSIAYPIIAQLDGSLTELKPDTTQTRTVHLQRKYFKDNNCLFMEARVLLGRVQAANRADFSDAVTVYRIDSLQNAYSIPTNNPDGFRYWRFIAHENRPCNIAELMFYGQNDSIPLSGKIITRDKGSFQNDPRWIPDMAFDGDALTFYDPPKMPGSPGGNWIGLDFGKPTHVNRVVILPRSDDNTVSPGDEYELKYWGKSGWVSLGKKVASDYVLDYDNVPSNALLLLSDLTRGKQERIFTYEQDKQIFW